LCFLLEDRGRITESMRILVPVDRMKQKCFQITTKQVRRSQQFQLSRQPVFFSKFQNDIVSVVSILQSVELSMFLLILTCAACDCDYHWQ